MFRVEYVAGVATGRYRQWSREGVLLMDGYLDRGERDGEWKVWYSNGHLRCSGRFARGKLSGQWSVSNYDGSDLHLVDAEVEPNDVPCFDLNRMEKSPRSAGIDVNGAK